MLRAADRADARARQLTAYRHATEAFADDPPALDVVARLTEDWSGTGDQLVAIVRGLLRAGGDH